LFSLLMLILFASISYYARSCGFEDLEKSTDKIMESIAKKLIVNVAGEEGFEKVKKIIRGR
ncbi:hypothetical protein, partial [Bacteroides faecis]|uniref:hypothetical protein n=1 Tax=Bacteroides faecis TaxID=674529 RepID=UPI0032ED3D3E